VATEHGTLADASQSHQKANDATLLARSTRTTPACRTSQHAIEGDVLAEPARATRPTWATAGQRQ
jgi:hypothetical protein